MSQDGIPETPTASFKKLQYTVSNQFSEFGGISDPSSPLLHKQDSALLRNVMDKTDRSFKLE